MCDILLLKLKLRSKRDYADICRYADISLTEENLGSSCSQNHISHMKGCETTTNTNSI